MDPTSYLRHKVIQCHGLTISYRPFLSLHLVSLFMCVCACRSRRKEVTQHDSEEHRDGPGGGDEEQDDSAGQQGVHRRQHEQLQLRGKVRTCDISGLRMICGVALDLTLMTSYGLQP